MSGKLPESAMELFALPLEEFTERKTELAKQLKAGGDKEASEAVARLKKPSVAVWALNQVAQQNPGEMQELTQALEALSEPKSRNEMRMASAKRSRSVASITDLAVQALEQHGHGGGAATSNKITQILLAIGTDDQRRAALAEGRLLDEHLSGDAGADIWSTPAPAVDAKPKKDTANSGAATGAGVEEERKILEEKIEKLASAAQRARREAEEADEIAREARREADAAEAAAQRIRREAEAAGMEAERAGKRADGAESTAARARKKADQAESALEQMQDELRSN